MVAIQHTEGVLGPLESRLQAEHAPAKARTPTLSARLARCLLLAVLAGCPLLGGCLTLPWNTEQFKETAPTARPVQIAVFPQNEVLDAPDAVHGGKLMKCIGGRYYLMAPGVASTVACDGQLRVELRCGDMRDPDGQPKLLEVWETFTPELLRQMLSKDEQLGWGYSLALPWSTYNPTLHNLTLTLEFTPTGGYPIFAHTKLNFQEPQVSQLQSFQVPGLKN